MTEEISGLIERVTFHNDESGFCVLRVRTRGHREETTAVGSLPSVTAGEWLVAEGWWVRDKEHGLQFKARSLKTVPPTTVEGIERQPKCRTWNCFRRDLRFDCCSVREALTALVTETTTMVQAAFWAL